jgi:anti-sigma factor (TIGR02949 family)
MEHQNCHELLNSLSDFVDGSLSPALCAEIEQHMDNCQNCRVVVDTLRRTILLYQQTNTAVEVPHDVRERLFYRLDLDDFLASE